MAEEPTLNAETLNYLAKAEERINNEFVDRWNRLFSQMFSDRNKDIESECGYPKTEELTPEKYKLLDDRDPIANRINNLFPSECWQLAPDIYEDEDIAVTTTFEQALKSVARNLSGSGVYEGEEGNPLWEYLERGDYLSGIGRYGVIVLGINKGAMDQPLPMIDFESDIVHKFEKDKITGQNTKYLGSVVNIAAVKPAPSGEDPKETTKLPKPVAVPKEPPAEPEPFKTDVALLYMRVLDETQAVISEREKDRNSPRFSKPTMYSITFAQDDDASVGPNGGSSRSTSETTKVHWTRVIHLADRLGTSEVIAKPRCQRYYNRLYDLHKLYGGSAEMYWQSASPGISFETHPLVGGNVKMDVESIKDAMERRRQGIQKDIMVPGLHANSLSPQISDPSNQIEREIEAICIGEACPKRVFMGSERGELSSNQDIRAWYSRVRKRLQRYVTPRILVPLINRLIQIKVLPMPEHYYIYWPDVSSVTDAEKADIGLKRMQACAAFLQGGVDAMMTPTDALVGIGYTEEEAKQIIANKNAELGRDEDDPLDVHEREDALAEEEAAKAAEEAERTMMDGGEQRKIDTEIAHRDLDIKELAIKTKPKPPAK